MTKEKSGAKHEIIAKEGLTRYHKMFDVGMSVNC